MPYQVVIVGKAAADLQHMHDWLHERSPTGAARWYKAFEAAIDALAADAGTYPKALEGPKLGEDIRECLFGTRSGKRYRVLFAIEQSRVFVLRIRGPGQRPLRRRDIRP